METSKKEGVWFRYRSIGSQDVHSVFTTGVQANRWLRRLSKLKRVDYLHVAGVYEPVIPKNITILRGQTDSDSRRASTYIPTGHTLRTPQESFYYMSFHAGKLDSDVLVFCPITGIFGKLEMPALPVALIYEHPLSVAGNALAVIKAATQYHDKTHKVFSLDRQVWAGLLLSLLSKKNLLRKTQGETTAAECNMVLQQAGSNILWHLVSLMERLWDNPNVWSKVPSLNVDWKAHATTTYSGTNIGQVLQAYTSIIRNTLEPLSMSSEDQARYLTSKADRLDRSAHARGYISIHDLSTREARNIRDSKIEARKLFERVSPTLSVITRITVAKVIKDLLLLPQSAKDNAADQLEAAAEKTTDLLAIGIIELATLIREAKNIKLLSEMGSFIQEVSPRPVRSIAEILEAKRLKREEKGDTNE